MLWIKSGLTICIDMACAICGAKTVAINKKKVFSYDKDYICLSTYILNKKSDFRNYVEAFGLES